MVDFAEQGILPTAGGVHDQAAAFIHALRFIREERNVIERQIDEDRRRRRQQQRGGQ